MKLLVIDEEPAAQKQIVEVANKLGLTVEVCSSARQALEYLRRGHWVDLIVTEYRFTDSSGPALLKTIRGDRRWASTPIIVCSSLQDSNAIVGAVQLGVRHYLIKPLEDAKLREKLQRVIDSVPPAVLVVDDEVVLRDLLRKIFTREGIRVLAADNGKSALEIVKTDSVALVVTDMKMPGMSGMELLAECKKVRPELPVLVMTGYGKEFDEDKLTQAGADGYILKPFHNADIIARVKPLLSASAKSQAPART